MHDSALPFHIRAAAVGLHAARGDPAAGPALPCGHVEVAAAVTASGGTRPIRWTGHRVIDRGRHPRPNEVLPVRIAAHAFGAGWPSRDLLVSPGHAICVDLGGEVLIPALALVNGTTITRTVVGSIAYWHVELDSHDVILAEGLPSESYLEMGNRRFFAESTVVTVGAASPDGDPTLSRTHADFCRPFESSGPVDAVRQRLDAIAARRDSCLKVS